MRQGWEMREEHLQHRLAWQTANIMNALGANVKVEDLMQTKQKSEPMTEEGFQEMKNRLFKKK